MERVWGFISGFSSSGKKPSTTSTAINNNEGKKATTTTNDTITEKVTTTNNGNNNKKRKNNDDEEILIGSTTNRTTKHFKKETNDDDDNKSPCASSAADFGGGGDVAAASAPSTNTLEQSLTAAGKEPCAFDFDTNKPPVVVSKDEILDYLDRHPSWYHLFGELIRIEKRDKEKEKEKKEEGPNKAPLTRAGIVLGSNDPFTVTIDNIIDHYEEEIRSSLTPPPTGLPLVILDNSDRYDNEIKYREDEQHKNVPLWSLSQEVRETLDLPCRFSKENNAKQKNHLLPLPPTKPTNKNAIITAIEVHFREEHHRNEGLQILGFDDGITIHYKICGWTFFYDDNMQILVGHAKGTSSFNNNKQGDNHHHPGSDGCGGKKKPIICTRTKKIELDKGEHIVAIDTGIDTGSEVSSESSNMLAFYTNKSRWHIAADGRSSVRETTTPTTGRPARYYETIPTAKINAPQGKIFQFFEAENYDDNPAKNIQNPTISFVSIPDDGDNNNASNEDRIVGMPEAAAVMAPLYVQCEDTLQDYYRKKKLTTHRKAYEDLKEIKKENYEECKKFGQNFADRLRTSSEAATVRILNDLMNFAITKMEEKGDVLLKQAREAYEPAYNASKLRIEQHKGAALEEQVQIYQDHVAFRKKCESLSGSCDDENDTTIVVGTERQVCFHCRRVYQPKQLSFVQRCQAEGFSSAFWNCGCKGIRICQDEREGVYCEDHCIDSEWSD